MVKHRVSKRPSKRGDDMTGDPETGGFDRAIRAHDARLAELGLEIWIGGEPTYTDRFAESTQWLAAALGEDKLQRAQALTAGLAVAGDGAAVMRTVGRQYPGEPAARWSLGIYRLRDGSPVWDGPPDPIRLDGSVAAPDLDGLAESIRAALAAGGLAVARVQSDTLTDRRLVFTVDGSPPMADPELEPRLLRPSLHGRALEAEDARDALAAEGLALLLIRAESTPLGTAACIELPGLAQVEAYLQLLAAIGAAAKRIELPALILAGYPPPVDAAVLWTTVTPDPAVIEVNAAPHQSVEAYLAAQRDIHRLAERQGLSPYRLHYNGDVADSGGGGQITLGGRTPAESPFIAEPQLLPRLIRYFNRHPALSYRFAHDYVGEWGQSVRADERGRESFAELGLALHLLDGEPELDAETRWRALAPFLTDLMGNAHRAELNVEKLWNPGLPKRGRMGVLEFRALRMQIAPERAAALGALLRAIVARLILRPYDEPLFDWGTELHDRFALPYYLDADLRAVLDDLDRAAVGLDPEITEVLLRDAWRHGGSVAFEGCRLTVRRALEFWPLVGDAAQQEGGGSRLIDSSTGRIELRLTSDSDDPDRLPDWRLVVNGWEVPLRAEESHGRPARLIGLRYRRFAPWQGLHPTLAPQGCIEMCLFRPGLRHALALTLHEWRPDNEAYDGLPASMEEAYARRQARLVKTLVPPPDRARPPHPASLSPYCLDLRRAGLGI
jgi:uncharacterized protein (DUF2126 family)